MVAHVNTATVVGLEAEVVDVEADVTNGLPATVIVGLPDAAVQESKERVRSALKNSELKYPQTRVSVNLAPADTQKIGTQFDVPIALAILLASEQCAFNVKNRWFVGELSLDGTLRHTDGILSMVLLARDQSYDTVFVPEVDGAEAALVDGVQVIPVPSLALLIAHLRGDFLLPGAKQAIRTSCSRGNGPYDLSAVRGQTYTQVGACRGAICARRCGQGPVREGAVWRRSSVPGVR